MMDSLLSLSLLCFGGLADASYLPEAAVVDVRRYSHASLLIDVYTEVGYWKRWYS